MIKSLLLPGSNDVSRNSDRVIPHTATMLFTNSGKNGYPKPQKPQQDYTPTECERETPMPWGMIMSLSLGGNCLNVWDNCADEKNAIHLSIPFKFIFLMRGDIVHGGALDNSKKKWCSTDSFLFIASYKTKKWTHCRQTETTR